VSDSTLSSQSTSKANLQKAWRREMHTLYRIRNEISKKINSLQVAKETETTSQIQRLEIEKANIKQRIKNHKELGKKHGYKLQGSGNLSPTAKKRKPITVKQQKQLHIQELRQKLHDLNQNIKELKRKGTFAPAHHRKIKQLDMERRKVLVEFRKIPELREEERVASESLGYRKARTGGSRKASFADRGPEWLRIWR
jgi:small-conductance mechanosensitive channel